MPTKRSNSKSKRRSRRVIGGFPKPITEQNKAIAHMETGVDAVKKLEDPATAIEPSNGASHAIKELNKVNQEQTIRADLRLKIETLRRSVGH